MRERFRFKLWIRAMRAPFFQAVIVPSLLGTAIVWYRTGKFYWQYFLLATLAVVFINAGTNLTNDYFDHQSRSDDINREATPFSGGSRVIQENLISPGRIYRTSLIFFGLAALIGLYLTLLTFPLAWKAMKIVHSNYSSTQELIPAMFSTVTVHLSVGILLSFGYILARIFT